MSFFLGSALIYLKGPKFLIYVSGALSMWVSSLVDLMNLQWKWLLPPYHSSHFSKYSGVYFVWTVSKVHLLSLIWSSAHLCYRVIVCGTLLSLSSSLNCMDEICYWLPCLAWWLLVQCCFLELWLGIGLIAIQGIRVPDSPVFLSVMMCRHSMCCTVYDEVFDVSPCTQPPSPLLSSIVVAHASLFIQNISVTVCSIVLMLVFSYKKWIEQIWDGWLTVSMIDGL